MRLWRGTTPGGRVSAESRRGKKRVTRMVIVVVVIFAVCWCPIQLLLVLKSLDIYSQTSAVIMLQIAAHCLAYMNSCVNPILYAFLSENFRKAFRKFFYCNPLVNASATTVANEQRGTTNGQPNNNAEKSKQRQSLYATNVNDITQMTLLKSNELELEAEHDAVDILWSRRALQCCRSYTGTIISPDLSRPLCSFSFHSHSPFMASIRVVGPNSSNSSHSFIRCMTGPSPS